MCDRRRITELVSTWGARALDELEVARRAADLPFACCFHCQQAVEKAIKALLVVHQIEFRKLHDIGQLLEILRRSPTVPPAQATHDLESLTRYAVDTRYPPGQADASEAVQALRTVIPFLEWARQNLPPDVPQGGTTLAHG